MQNAAVAATLEAVPSITIRNVPVNVRNELAARAARKGQSLQEYMLDALSRMASKPTVEEVTARIEERLKRSPTKFNLDEAIAELRERRGS